MKPIFAVFALVLALITQPSLASVRVFNSSGTQLGTYTDLQLGNGLAVAQVSGKAKASQTSGDGTVAIAGFLHSQTSVSGSLTAAQCGSTVTSDATGGSTPTFTLPAISSSLGCRYTFIVGSKRILLAPQSTDKVLIISGTVNHTVSADIPGSTVTLEAISPGWAPSGYATGSWFGN